MDISSWFSRNKKRILKTALVWAGIIITYLFFMGLRVSIAYDVGWDNNWINVFDEINSFNYDWLRGNFSFVLDPFYNFFAQNNLITLLILFTIIFIALTVLVTNWGRISNQVNTWRIKRKKKKKKTNR